MQPRIKLLNSKQQEGVKAWIKAKGVGTLNCAVGFGKNFTAFKCIYAALAKKWIKKGDCIRFFAETNTRELTLIEEAEKFEKLEGKDILSDFDIKFYCYQGVPTLSESKLDIYDEIHETLTAKYYNNIKYGAKYKIGLSATIQNNTSVFRNEIADTEINNVFQTEEQTKAGEITTWINKGQLLEILCPICFTYTLDQGILDGILSPFQTYILEHNLETLSTAFKIWKSKNLMGSEQKYYNSRARMMGNYKLPGYLKKNFGKEMSKFMYNLPSKVEPIKKLLETLEGKTIIFGVELDILRKITPNVVEGKNTKELIDKFNKGKIKVIASAKKLKQGITLEGVENCILVSYYSTFSNAIQQLGRVVRFVEGKMASLYIIVTNNTYEERWFSSMTKIKDKQGKIVEEVNLNIKDYITTKSLIH